MNLTGKIALVTGGGRGIGKGCALELARHGADILLNDRPGSPDLMATADEIRALGRQCTPIEADAFSRTGCEQMVAAALKATERIDILVSNPAFSRKIGFLDSDPDLFDKTLQRTLTGGFHIGQIVAQHMVDRGGGGKIVFISSVHGEMPISLANAYNAAKAGLNHLARSMSVELLPHRINVNAIAPGWIDTPGEREHFTEDTIEQEGPKLPWGRMGRPDEIGSAAAFLCSNNADYITGIVLPVDGGIRFKGCAADEIATPKD
jgi:glucose 1-dehydrogenase